MAIPAQDHHCLDATGYHDYVLRVLTGKIVYRLSSVLNDFDGGPCVLVRQVAHTGELGPRELISLRKLKAATVSTCVSPRSNNTFEPTDRVFVFTVGEDGSVTDIFESTVGALVGACDDAERVADKLDEVRDQILAERQGGWRVGV